MEPDLLSTLREAIEESLLVEEERAKKQREIEGRLISKLSRVPVGQKFKAYNNSYEVVDLVIVLIVEQVSRDEEATFHSLLDMLDCYLKPKDLDDPSETKRAKLKSFLDKRPRVHLRCICTSTDDSVLKGGLRSSFLEENVFNYLKSKG